MPIAAPNTLSWVTTHNYNYTCPRHTTHDGTRHFVTIPRSAMTCIEIWILCLQHTGGIASDSQWQVGIDHTNPRYLRAIVGGVGCDGWRVHSCLSGDVYPVFLRWVDARAHPVNQWSLKRPSRPYTTQIQHAKTHIQKTNMQSSHKSQKQTPDNTTSWIITKHY